MTWTIGGGGVGGGGRQTFTPAQSPFASIAARDTWAAANLSMLFNTNNKVTDIVANDGSNDELYRWSGDNMPSSYNANAWIKMTDVLDSGEVKMLYESNPNTNPLTDLDNVTLNHFKYDPVTNMLVSNRSIQALLGSLLLGTGFRISSGSDQVITTNLLTGVDYLSPSTGIKDQSVSANQDVTGLIPLSVPVLSDDLLLIEANGTEDTSGAVGYESTNIVPFDLAVSGISFTFEEPIVSNDFLFYEIFAGTDDTGDLIYQQLRSGLVLSTGATFEWYFSNTLFGPNGLQIYTRLSIAKGGEDETKTILQVRRSATQPTKHWVESKYRTWTRKLIAFKDDIANADWTETDPANPAFIENKPDDLISSTPNAANLTIKVNGIWKGDLVEFNLITTKDIEVIYFVEDHGILIGNEMYAEEHNLVVMESAAASVTVTLETNVLVLTGTASQSVSLPAASSQGDGHELTIYNNGTASTTLTSDFYIDGVNVFTYVLEAGEVITLVDDGTHHYLRAYIRGSDRAKLNGIETGAQVNVVEWESSVISEGLLLNPTNPSTGDRYIIGATGANLWTSHGLDFAEWNGTAWQFTTPKEGSTAFNSNLNKFNVFRNSVWTVYSQFTDAERDKLNSTTATILEVNQGGHGFVVDDVLYRAGSTYAKAQANNLFKAQAVGVVTNVINTGSFELTISGYVDSLSGLVAGSHYYLSTSVAGGFTTSISQGAGHYLKPILTAISATEAIIHDNGAAPNLNAYVAASISGQDLTLTKNDNSTTVIVIPTGVIAPRYAEQISGTFTQTNSSTDVVIYTLVDMDLVSGTTYQISFTGRTTVLDSSNTLQVTISKEDLTPGLTKVSLAQHDFDHADVESFWFLYTPTATEQVDFSVDIKSVDGTTTVALSNSALIIQEL